MCCCEGLSNGAEEQCAVRPGNGLHVVGRSVYLFTALYAQGIELCQRWSEMYDLAAAASARCAAGPWTFDRTPIFAHIHVFEQRCR